MIPLIRPASQEEIDQIKDKADLATATSVMAWSNDKGGADLAVVRVATELDPVIFAPTSGSQRKALFGWAVMNMLKATGAKEVYFEVDAEGAEDFAATLEKMGAEKTTPKPQWRYKLVL